VALPDGRLVVEEDAITGVESLFDPSVLGQRSHDDAANAQAQGLRPTLHLSYTRSDLDLRTEMCKNVLLVGSLPAVACCWANRVVADHFLHTHTHTHNTRNTTHTHTQHNTPHTTHTPSQEVQPCSQVKLSLKALAVGRERPCTRAERSTASLQGLPIVWRSR
jgi:hypothetical protein